MNTYTIVASVPRDYFGENGRFMARDDIHAAQIVRRLLIAHKTDLYTECERLTDGRGNILDPLTVTYARQHGFTLFDSAWREVDCFSEPMCTEITSRGRINDFVANVTEDAGTVSDTERALARAIAAYGGCVTAHNTERGAGMGSCERRKNHAMHARHYAEDIAALLTGMSLDIRGK